MSRIAVRRTRQILDVWVIRIDSIFVLSSAHSKSSLDRPLLHNAVFQQMIQAFIHSVVERLLRSPSWIRLLAVAVESIDCSPAGIFGRQRQPEVVLEDLKHQSSKETAVSAFWCRVGWWQLNCLYDLC